MSYLATAQDLKTDALFLAGEPGDGTSQYDALCYEWLTTVQRALISGGQFGPSGLEPVDWLWARAWPRGTIQMTQPANQTYTAALTVTLGSRAAVAAPMLPDPFDLSGWRLQQDATPARHVISVSQQDRVNNQTLLTLQEPWTGATMTTANWVA